MSAPSPPPETPPGDGKFKNWALGGVCVLVGLLLCKALKMPGVVENTVAAVAVGLPGVVVAKRKGGKDLSRPLLVTLLAAGLLLLDSAGGFLVVVAGYLLGSVVQLLVFLGVCALIVAIAARLVPRLGTGPYLTMALAVGLAFLIRLYVVAFPMREIIAESFADVAADTASIVVYVTAGHLLYLACVMLGTWLGRRRLAKRSRAATAGEASEGVPDAATPQESSERSARLDTPSNSEVSAGPAPDWYLDPEDPSQLRYWDGARWTASQVPDDGNAAPVAGWYSDPDRPDLVRWWDGHQWSDHRRHAPVAADAVPAKD